MYDVELTREELEHNIKVLRGLRDHLERQVGDLRREVEVERTAKSRAYAFILESGLYDQFVEYSKRNLYGNNPHQTCVEYLDHIAKQNK